MKTLHLGKWSVFVLHNQRLCPDVAVASVAIWFSGGYLNLF